MIIFPEWWLRERDDRLARYYADQTARRLADLRCRLLAPLPSFLLRPGAPLPIWNDHDSATIDGHADNLAALLKLANVSRDDFPNADALRAAIIRRAPLLDAGRNALGTLSLHPCLFAGVVAAFDRRRTSAPP